MTDDDCLGVLCLPLDGTAGVCSAPCRLGNVLGCGFRNGAIDAGPVIGACLYGPETAGIGDVGACAQLCDTASDCTLKAPDWACNQDPTVKAMFGHGFCTLSTGADQ